MSHVIVQQTLFGTVAINIAVCHVTTVRTSVQQTA